MQRGLGQKLEEIAAGGQIDHLARAARHVTGKEGQYQQAGDQNDHLHEIRHCHGPHAAEQRVDQHGEHAYRHAHGNADDTAREQVEHQAQRRDLGRNPAQIAEHDDQRADHLDSSAIARAVVVADGQQIHAVELGRKKHTHQNQAHARAKRIFHQRMQSAFDELGRHAQHQLGPEPGRKGGGDDHVERQMTAGNGEIRRVFHTFGGPQTNADGHEQVDDHQ